MMEGKKRIHTIIRMNNDDDDDGHMLLKMIV